MGVKKDGLKNPELLALVRTLPCTACRVEPCGEAHHVTTRGAGGGDEFWNVMPLCHGHHMEWHLNPGKMIRRYAGVFYWLECAGREDVLERYGIRDIADLNPP